MAENIQKMIIVPVDGSENALKPLDYINLVFGPQHNLKTILFYVLPKLPTFLIEESRKDQKMMKTLQDVERRNTEMAQRLLNAASEKLINTGFTAEAVEAVFRKIEVGIARDIVHWSEKKRADAIILSTRGRSKLEVFFTGEIANKVLEYSRVCPVWMVKGTVKKKDAILAIDNSENALRAVDHASFMLSGTNANVTIFHSKRDLRRFIPRAVIDEFPEVQKYWRHKVGEQIVPFMQRAKDMLLAAGLAEDQISTKAVDGSRSAAEDILDEAQNNDAGTIILGLRGYSGVKDFTMGGVTRKVLNRARDTTVSIVP
jgi:nucleotide-binding universal stress UspA family protein